LNLEKVSMYQGPFWDASISSAVHGIPLYYGTRTLFTIFIEVRCLDEIWTRWNTFPPSSPICLRYIFYIFLTCGLRYSTWFHSLIFPTKLMPAFLSFLICTTFPACLILDYEQKILRHIKLISCIKPILINFIWTEASFVFVLHCICIVLYLYCIVFLFVLYCIVLYCIVLYCIVLYCIVLYCICRTQRLHYLGLYTRTVERTNIAICTTGRKEEERWFAKHQVITRHFGAQDLVIRRKPQRGQSSRGMCK
jgi:hypothetical protein